MPSKERPEPAFSARLKALRTKAGMTQDQLARELGVRGQTVSEWERGVMTPRPLTQEAILRRLEAVKPKPRSPRKPAP